MSRLFLILAASIGLFMIALSPAHAKLYQTQSIATVTFNSTTFGPVGPNCSATDGGPDCAFFTSTFTTTTQNNPFGPSTGTGTATALFGVDGQFVTPSGAHDTNGNPTGGCFPTVSTETDTYNDGSTLNLQFHGTNCCADLTCSNGAFGPPNVVTSAYVITAGTKRFAGATGTGSGSITSTSSGAGALDQFQGILQLP